MIFLLIFIIILVYFLMFIFQNHLHIDWKSFFKAGFSKRDNAFGLYTYTGKQGEGKTYSAIKFISEQKNRFNYIVVTNVHSFKEFDDTVYIDDIMELIDFIKLNHEKNGKKYLIFFDEIFTVLMKGQAINNEILSFLAQLRKRSIIFVTTAQEWSEIPLTFRRFCRFQISCHMFSIPLINKAFLSNKINDGYNAKWNNDTQEFEAPVLQTNFSKGNLRIINMYDTFEVIKTSNKSALLTRQQRTK